MGRSTRGGIECGRDGVVQAHKAEESQRAWRSTSLGRMDKLVTEYNPAPELVSILLEHLLRQLAKQLAVG